MPGLQVKTRSSGTTELTVDAFVELEGKIGGPTFRPVSAGYDEARKVHNAMHDRRPALIVQATAVSEVITAVKFARDRDLVLAVRGGGHSVSGFATCDGGLVLDLRRMNHIQVDPVRRTVRAEGGCTWGELDKATHDFGLATTGGIVSTTGIAGLTLGGGLGYLNRRCGLSCDNLVSADVVLADGTLVTCGERQEPDLFWAIRGGGGNFGVVTAFEFRLHPVGDIFGGPTFFSVDGDVLRAYRDFILEAPEELGAVFAFTMAPPLPFLPPEWHFKPVSAVVACWTGPLEDGEGVLAPLQKWGRVVGAYTARMPYPSLNSLFDELARPGLQQYWKGNFVRSLSDEAVEAHLPHARRVPTIESGTFIFPLDGACGRVPPDATAFAYRRSAFATVISGAWPDPADNQRNIAWVRDYYAAIRPHSEEGGYVNFMSEDDNDRVRGNYGANYDRLVALKSRYDPENLFQLNQNIRPGSSSGAAL
jgi:FAD/FMN-containing dehydrogenase